VSYDLVRGARGQVSASARWAVEQLVALRERAERIDADGFC